MITAENSNTFEFISLSGVAETQYTIYNTNSIYVEMYYFYYVIKNQTTLHHVILYMLQGLCAFKGYQYTYAILYVISFCQRLNGLRLLHR